MYYIVQPGDSLHNIAMQYHTTVRRLMNLNPRISNPNKIHVGQRIEVGNQWSALNPWRGNEYQRGQEEYKRGREAYRRGQAEYRRGREYSKHHDR
ncbi:LysM domain-containing protein [Desulfosporosinus sp. BG]|uniref:LysM peptidoglycan-binding domain-containing protein n=1 Tax=Desulfosporosinus sp. BG TaxID=1633135 RepID=UPI00083A8AE4|nr:LysM domain-containing protein [Desulfosporosinus sp. BG]